MGYINDELLYTYIQALTERYGAQRITVNLPDGSTYAALAWADRKWKKGKFVEVKAKNEPHKDTEAE